MSDEPKLAKPAKKKLPPLKKRWGCVAKALDLFEKDTLGAFSLYSNGEYCAIGAVLHASGTTESEFLSYENSLYDQFKERFGIHPADLHRVNDGAPVFSNEERLRYVRLYAKERAKGASELTASRRALGAMHEARKVPDGGE